MRLCPPRSERARLHCSEYSLRLARSSDRRMRPSLFVIQNSGGQTGDARSAESALAIAIQIIWSCSWACLPVTASSASARLSIMARLVSEALPRALSGRPGDGKPSGSISSTIPVALNRYLTKSAELARPTQSSPATSKKVRMAIDCMDSLIHGLAGVAYIGDICIDAGELLFIYQFIY